MTDQFAAVLIPRPFDRSFEYIASDMQHIHIGDIVRVSFGKQDLIGIVEAVNTTSTVDPKKLKPILEVVRSEGISNQDMTFIKWMASYTMMPVGMIVKMVLPVPQAFDVQPEKYGYRFIKDAVVDALTPKQKKLFSGPVDFTKCYSLKELQDLTGVSSAIIKGALEKGALEKCPLPRTVLNPDPEFYHPVYEYDQAAVVESLRGYVKENSFQPILVHGVTGSGKTEVYFEAIATALHNDQQSLVMLPEISLTPQWLERFEGRFGCKPHLWHSQMTPAQRRETFRAIQNGQAKVVVGARSALFLPYKNLGVLVVDEEHEGSYKQEEAGIYHARDMAVVRAFHQKIPVILVSATPSMESYQNALDGKYKLLTLPKRHGGAKLPDMHLIDMRSHEKTKDGQAHFLSTNLKEKLAQNLSDGEQSLLFLNRRGYAPLTLCRSCGERLECPRCTAWVVLHKRYNQAHLSCHHCGFQTVMPDACHKCEAKDAFVNCGPGVERIAEEVSVILPEAKTLIMASDFFESTDELVDSIRSIQSGDIDIIIGTQMMAKGHHFPKLTLVGIVDADLGLMGGDLRACEKTYQLLQQVAGRCGRAERPGDVYLQTYHPDHPVMQALISGNEQAYREQELLMRQQAGMPPFSKLAAIIVSSPDQTLAETYVRQLSANRPRADGLEILGPAPAPIAKLRNAYRYRFLLKTPKGFAVQNLLKAWMHSSKPPHNVRVAIDIDPISFM